MSHRITVRDVAAAAGVHFTTAARALKEDGRISAATIKRVCKVARQLGYISDPAMSAFSSYRHQGRASAHHGTFAWITNFPSCGGWRNAVSGEYMRGAMERGSEIGYRIEEFWLREPGMTTRRAVEILLNRGIRGLLLAPQPRQHGHLSLPWSSFSCVCIGFSMSRPQLHRVAPSHFSAVVTCFRKLRAQGYRRIGFVCERARDERNDRLWSAGFLSQRDCLSESRAVPLLIGDPLTPDLVRHWFRRYRPAALILPRQEPSPLQWLEASRPVGSRFPGIALLNAEERGTPKFSGVSEESAKIGAASVNLLADLVRRGERGIPETPLRVLVEGRWVRAKEHSIPV